MDKTQEVKVWDPLVRIFHWSLVVAFTVAYLTGEDESDLHIWFGYAVLALIGIRLVWGFVGSRHARFSDFIFSPATVIAYARDELAGRAKRYLGHNPLGGVMVVALLASLLITGVTGYALYTTEAPHQESAALVTHAPTGQLQGGEDEHEEHESEEVLEEVHEFFANLTLALVILHILGVVWSSYSHRENLPRAMVTGRKRA